MRLHSVIGLVTNSSSEVFWLPAEHDPKHVAEVIDVLWRLWKTENPEDAKSSWFSGPPEEIPETVSDRYSIKLLAPSKAEKTKTHWLNCGFSSLTMFLGNLKEKHGVEVLQAVREKLQVPASEYVKWLDECHAEMIKVIDIVIATKQDERRLTFWDIEGKLFPNIDKYLVLKGLFSLRIDLIELGIPMPPFNDQLVNAKRDFDWSEAIVPGGVEVNADYNAAPEEFTEWVRDLWGAQGGQVG